MFKEVIKSGFPVSEHRWANILHTDTKKQKNYIKPLVYIDIFVTPRNSDRKIMQSIRITSRPPLTFECPDVH